MIATASKSLDWSVVRVVTIAILLSAFSCRGAAEPLTDAIRAYLVQRVDAKEIRGGIVVGIIDEHVSSIVGYGRLDNGTDQQLDGETVFEIGSVVKTFTALLLQDMIERGQMKLDDPVAKYLPESVKLPTHAGKEITLRHLATHTSGLPGIPDNLDPKRADNPYADYTVDKMYAFLSGYQLTRVPGATSEYSNMGMGLLGHAIALTTGESYESLVADRICQPLGMDSTRITLTPQLKSRFATGHNRFGEPVRHWDVPTLAGAGALRSTANDMLKYVSANLGLSRSHLTPLMQQTHDSGLAWYVALDVQGTKIVGHGGGTAGCNAFAGFDQSRKRGVVVLSNTTGVIDTESLGKFLLVSEWNSDVRPKAAKTGSQVFGANVGQYERSPDATPRIFQPLQPLLRAPKVAILIPAGICLAVLAALAWRVGSFRWRSTILGCAFLLCGLVAALLLPSSRRTNDPLPQSGIGLRYEGDRLFTQVTGARSWPIEVFVPPISGELLPQSESRFFERLSGRTVIFSRDAQGTVTGLTTRNGHEAFLFKKVSDQPPKAPEPLKPRVAIELDSKLLDECVGSYEFAPTVDLPTGMKLTIRREGNHLVGQAHGKNVLQGLFDIYPESDTTFFIKVDGAQLTFIKNDREVTTVTHHQSGLPDIVGTKLKAD